MEIVHVRGRVMSEVNAFFMARHDPSKRGEYGEELATHGIHVQLEVDGRPIKIELAPDIESYGRGSFSGRFREAREGWDETFPFDTSPTGSGDDVISVVRFGLRRGLEIEVWGEVLDHELAPTGYREGSSTRPTAVRARVIDAPVSSPPVITSWRIGVIGVLAAIAATSLVVMGPAMPMIRFWSFLALSIAVSRAHWTIVPDATDGDPWESPFPALMGLLSHLAIVVFILTAGAYGWWVQAIAASTLGLHAFGSLALRGRRMRRLREVARRIGIAGELGIVAAVANREIGYRNEVVRSDTLVVAFDRDLREVTLSEVAFDSHNGNGARPGTRVVVGDGALYASREDPRAELEQIVIWDGRLRWAAAALGLAMPVITYLAYRAPIIS